MYLINNLGLINTLFFGGILCLLIYIVIKENSTEMYNVRIPEKRQKFEVSQPAFTVYPRESKLERATRHVLEKIFNRPFPKVRPDFLKNPVTNRNLELDCYNEDLKIAVEVQGRQHYDYSFGMHTNKQDYNSQQYRDHIKRELCAKNGIKLIEVPYTVSQLELEGYILKQLQNNS